MADEIELKFEIKDYNKIAKQILEFAKFKKSAYEKTIMYDNKEKSLFKEDARLRLRIIKDLKSEDEICEISHKKPKTREGIKIEDESETKVSSYQQMEEILEKLGFNRVSSYERIRDTFEANSCKITIDSFPFGDYIEVEGDLAEIKKIAGKLGLKMENNITKSCDDIYAELCIIERKEVDDHIKFQDKEELKKKEEERAFLLK